ncbi:fasciclin domain-containing protein [Oleiphilus sp. HI0125]|uniref:fasciclin domain-containing protein n=1 Tax=Oleiphilus sp. HI0125 TaxID=1822266 RepID=UPI000A410B92|nr:fasciclin domain-containing protein [Oleiphilus sp. HI0125]
MSMISFGTNVKRWAPLMILGAIPLISACSDSDDNVAAAVETRNILEVATDNPNTTILESAVVDADPSIAALLSGDDELTVFAPTDDAFAALLTDLGVDAPTLLGNTALLNQVLPYHVLATSVGEVDSTGAISVAQTPAPGNIVPTQGTESVALSLSSENNADVLYVNTSRVVTPDVDATNGVIHVIDKVLLPPPSELSDESTTIGGIVTALAGASDAEFTILLAALQTAGASGLLAAAVDPNATLTVFAPTDAAFATLLSEEGLTDAQLLASPDLPGILSQHILGKEVSSILAYASNGGTETTLAMNNLNIDIMNNALMIEGSTVVEADVKASNGVIHVIDKVIFTVD